MCTDLLLREFYVRALDDNRITVRHISLYMALVHEMIGCGGMDLLFVRTERIMGLAKISSRVTYHRCIRDLHCYGYIIYSPSFRPGESKVKMIEL